MRIPAGLRARIAEPEVLNRILALKSRGVPTIDAVSFDTSGYTERELSPERKIWLTDEGDGVSLRYFAQKPILPENMPTIAALRERYLIGLAGSKTQLVECDTLEMVGCRSLRVIVKAPAAAGEIMYAASITIPRRYFSFALKILCPERDGGQRESALREKLASGEIAAEVAGQWTPDDRSYDAEFPQSAVARARRFLARCEASVKVDTRVTSAAEFALPEL
jgi:hypothetical protein